MYELNPQGFQSPQADHRHEVQDVRARPILIAALALLLLAFITFTVLWGLLAEFNAHPPVPAAALSPLARASQTPPAPRLQVNPQEDLGSFRAQEERLLNGYNWVDRSKGVVQIPVERAKELILREGLK